jgi:hypothetical protein
MRTFFSRGQTPVFSFSCRHGEFRHLKDQITDSTANIFPDSPNQPARYGSRARSSGKSEK